MTDDRNLTATARYSISELTLPDTSFREDVDLISGSLATGIGLWEEKLAGLDAADAISMLAGAGLTATLCFPRTWSIFPNARMMIPADPEQRVVLICESVSRLAPFHPVGIVVTPGTAPDGGGEEARDVMIRNLRTVARHAADLGTTIALEPIRQMNGGFISSFADALRYRDEVGEPSLQIMLDVWHIWDEPSIGSLIQANVDALVGVQLNDWREPTRRSDDRVLPGDGVAGVAKLLAALVNSGYQGWYDLEIMSALELPDSLWRLPPRELLSRADERFRHVWEQAQAMASGRTALSDR